MPFTETERKLLYEDIKRAMQHQINEVLHDEDIVPDEVYQTVQRNLDSKKGE